MEHRKKNRELVCTIGDIVSALYTEVEPLPLSERAKQALVMIMLSDIMKRDGRVVNFNLPAQLLEAAAA